MISYKRLVGLSSALLSGLCVYDTKRRISDIERVNRTKLIFICNLNSKCSKSSNILKYVYFNIVYYLFKDHVFDTDDDIGLRRVFNKYNDRTIQLVIKSYGGLWENAVTILNMLEYHPHMTISYVPEYALSAASSIVLASSKIYMNNYATLGPTDPQMSFTVNGIKQIVSYPVFSERYGRLPKLDQLFLSELLYKHKVLYYKNFKLTVKNILKHKKPEISDNDISKLIRQFTGEDVHHSYEINSNYIGKFLNISIGIPDDIQRIYNIISFIFIL